MFDLLIIGGGPAGVSAALYALRAGLNTAIVYKDYGSLGKAEGIENFYGLAPDRLTPTGEELAKRGLEQARALGAEIINEEIVNLTFEQHFSVGKYEAKTVLLATGATHAAPNIPGLKGLEGHGVSYCAVCDGFFYRKKDVAVLGSGAFALHEAEVLLPLANSVTILTNGKALTLGGTSADAPPAGVPAAEVPKNIQIITEPVTALNGESLLESVSFADGGCKNVAGLFVAVGVAGGTDLARKMGAVTKDNYVAADAAMRTNVPGLWAAGDCTGGMRQVAKAVYEGALAGSDIAKSLRERN